MGDAGSADGAGVAVTGRRVLVGRAVLVGDGVGVAVGGTGVKVAGAVGCGVRLGVAVRTATAVPVGAVALGFGVSVGLAVAVRAAASAVSTLAALVLASLWFLSASARPNTSAATAHAMPTMDAAHPIMRATFHFGSPWTFLIRCISAFRTIPLGWPTLAHTRRPGAKQRPDLAAILRALQHDGNGGRQQSEPDDPPLCTRALILSNAGASTWKSTIGEAAGRSSEPSALAARQPAARR